MPETTNFEDLQIPFVVPAADLLTGTEVVFRSGPVLPAIRASISMPGCSLWVSLDLSLGLQNSGGSAAWALAVPNVASLQGAAVYFQAGVLDPTANALGIAMANALETSLAIR